MLSIASPQNFAEIETGCHRPEKKEYNDWLIDQQHAWSLLNPRLTLLEAMLELLPFTMGFLLLKRNVPSQKNKDSFPCTCHFGDLQLRLSFVRSPVKLPPLTNNPPSLPQIVNNRALVWQDLGTKRSMLNPKPIACFSSFKIYTRRKTTYR